MAARGHLKELRRRRGGEEPAADARHLCGDREKLIKIEQLSSSRGSQICVAKDPFDRVNVRTELVL